jgi:DNA-binding MurR/RpiR family transcriptional regulator
MTKKAAPATFEELRTELQLRLPKLAPGQSRIARVLLTDPEGCAFRTIGEMAKAADVHESSIVRFSTSLGLDGYPGLAKLCRQDLADQVRIVRRFEFAQERAAVDDPLSAAVQYDTSNLDRTFARIQRPEWDRTVELLASAPAVHTVGLRQCFTVAYLLAYQLRLVREKVRQVTPDAGLMVDQLRDMSPGDALVAVAIHPCTAATVKTLAYGREHGLRTIALTDNPASPLAAEAEIVFYVDTSGVALLRSLTAFTCISQALVTAVALRSRERSRASVAEAERLFDEFDLYTPSTGRPFPAIEQPAENGERPRAASRGARRGRAVSATG